MSTSHSRRHSATDPPSSLLQSKNQPAVTPIHRNSISRAAIPSEPIHARSKPDAPDPPGPKLAKSQMESVLGLGKPPAALSNSTKRHFSTSDLPLKSTTNSKKIKAEVDLDKNNDSNETLRCHQCRLEVHLEDIISCSNQESIRSTTKSRNSEPTKPSHNTDSTSPHHQNPTLVTRPCRKSFCARCLSIRYGEDLRKVRPTIKASYKWNCPACKDYCNCSHCRRKKGLLPTGKLAKLATEAGCMSARELLEVNPNIQGSELIIQEANRREKEKTKQVLPTPTTTTSSKSKLNHESSSKSSVEPKASSSKSISATKKSLLNHKNLKKKIAQHPTNHEKKIKKNKKDFHVIQQNNKKLKKQQQSAKSISKKKSTNLTPAQPKPSQKIPSSKLANNNNERPKKKNEKTAELPLPSPPPPPKVPAKRAPAVVHPPTKIFNLPRGGLSSSEIINRINVREFISRFRKLIPGLGGTEESKNGKNRTESERACKLLDSMDDLLNFWIDDEGGMRAILNGLVRLIERDLNSNPESSSQVLKSDQTLPLLNQLKRESKFSVVPSPYHQSSVPCWITATNFLKSEGLENQLEEDIRNSNIISSSKSSLSTTKSNTSDSNLIHDDRLQKVKYPPAHKLAIISSLIDVALRGRTLSDDLIQGIERERQAKAELMKQRAKLNKKWMETKAKKNANMPMKKSLLIKSTEEGEGNAGDQKMIEHPSKELLEQESARVQALIGWEADMNQEDCAHKNEMRRTNVEQFEVECSNRLRFQFIGQDAGERRYYVLSSTPGGVYPQDPTELDFAWSYNLIIHGAELFNRTKGKLKYKKSMEGVDGELRKAKISDDKKAASVAQVDCESNVHWFRISDPDEIRQVASWIEYQAKLFDIENSPSNLNGVPNPAPSARGSNGLSNGDTVNLVNSNDCNSSSALKYVANLVDHIHRFADVIQSKLDSQLEVISNNDRRTCYKNFRNL